MITQEQEDCLQTPDQDTNSIVITLTIYNNIKSMIKSSNEEDFFLAIKMWTEMSPPDYLTVMMIKHAFKGRYHAFQLELERSKMWPKFLSFSPNILGSWSTILSRTVANPIYTEFRDIIEQEFNAYMNKKLENEGMLKSIKQIKTEIKWQN